MLITNNSGCGAAKLAERNGIPVAHISRKKFPDFSARQYSELFINALRKHKIDFIVLAGYMKLIENDVLRKFRNRVVNIHPALLPSFGGKGMYGMNVHRAVIKSGVKVSGVTIHFVNENYDEGGIIFQKCCEIKSGDDAIALQKRILKMEHRYYPEVIKKLEDGNIVVKEKKSDFEKNIF